MTDVSRYRLGLERARQSLDNCRARAQSLESVSNEVQARTTWVEFLKHYTDCFSFLHRATDHGKNKGYSDSLKNQQKRDLILNYLLHARNADEHSIDYVSHGMPGSVNIGDWVKLESGSRDCTVMLYDNVTGNRIFEGIVSANGGKATGAWSGSIEPKEIPAHLRISSVFDRGIKYDPPRDDCSEDALCSHLCAYCIDWLSDKILEVERLAEKA